MHSSSDCVVAERGVVNRIVQEMRRKTRMCGPLSTRNTGAETTQVWVLKVSRENTSEEANSDRKEV